MVFNVVSSLPVPVHQHFPLNSIRCVISWPFSERLQNSVKGIVLQYKSVNMILCILKRFLHTGMQKHSFSETKYLNSNWKELYCTQYYTCLLYNLLFPLQQQHDASCPLPNIPEWKLFSYWFNSFSVQKFRESNPNSSSLVLWCRSWSPWRRCRWRPPRWRTCLVTTSGSLSTSSPRPSGGQRRSTICPIGENFKVSVSDTSKISRCRFLDASKISRCRNAGSLTPQRFQSVGFRHLKDFKVPVPITLNVSGPSALAFKKPHSTVQYSVSVYSVVHTLF